MPRVSPETAYFIEHVKFSILMTFYFLFFNVTVWSDTLWFYWVLVVWSPALLLHFLYCMAFGSKPKPRAKAGKQAQAHQD